MEALVEMMPFLAPSSRLDLKVVALHHVLGLTGSKEGRALMMEAAKDGKTMEEILLALTHDDNESVEKDAALALINLSVDEEVAVKMRVQRSYPTFGSGSRTRSAGSPIRSA